MLVEIVETFKKLSDGSILRPGDTLDIPQEKALRLIEKGRARLLPRCGTCQHFERDDINPETGAGDCKTFFLPDGKRQIVRYPMQHPRTDDCFIQGGMEKACGK